MKYEIVTMRILKSKIKRQDADELAEYDELNFRQPEEQWGEYSFRYYTAKSCWTEKYRLDCGYSKPIIACMMVTDDDDYFENSYYISTISVSENFRGKGLATKMMKSFCDYLLIPDNIKHNLIKLEVLPDNQEAKEFYNKIGFDWVTTRDNHNVLEISVDDFIGYFVV